MSSLKTLINILISFLTSKISLCKLINSVKYIIIYLKNNPFTNILELFI